MAEKRNMLKVIKGFRILREKLGDTEMLDSLYDAINGDDLGIYVEKIARVKNLYIDIYVKEARD